MIRFSDLGSRLNVMYLLDMQCIICNKTTSNSQFIQSLLSVCLTCNSVDKCLPDNERYMNALRFQKIAPT